MEDQIYYLIKDSGIPTALCVIMMIFGRSVLLKMSDVLEKNTEAIRELKTVVQLMGGKLKITLK